MKDPAAPGRLMARWMSYAFWLVLLLMLTYWFNRWHMARHNPSPHLVGLAAGSEVSLQRNAYGHYVAGGLINGQTVTFLLDTGATTISIPAPVADRLQLQGRGFSQVNTANGTIQVANVRLARVSLGGIELRDIQAHINPHMQGETVLLGMSFMRHLEMVQRGETLTLRPLR